MKFSEYVKIKENLDSSVYDTGPDHPLRPDLKQFYHSYIEPLAKKLQLPYDVVGKIWLEAYNTGYTHGWNGSPQKPNPKIELLAAKANLPSEIVKRIWQDAYSLGYSSGQH